MSITPERKLELIKTYGVGKNDTGSAPVQIAILSERIRNLTGHFGGHKKDFHSRRGMLQMVATRRSLMEYYKKVDAAAYAKLIASLGIRG